MPSRSLALVTLALIAGVVLSVALSALSPGDIERVLTLYRKN